ncbi:hypothetical protein H9Q69_003659 [Fusarium xylarioides]|nr:hypothetical protein H9Q69_003659 [Fusarium xylarioides]
MTGDRYRVTLFEQGDIISFHSASVTIEERNTTMPNESICRCARAPTGYYHNLMRIGVATRTHEELLQFPASDVVNYKKLSHGKQHYALCGGVSQVQAKLAEGLEDVNLNSRVIEAVPQVDGTVLVRWQSTVDASGRIHEQIFDRVVLSVSPDVAGRIFKQLGSTLAKLPTRRVESSVLKPEKAGISVVDTDNADSSQSIACMHHSKDTSAAQVLTLRTLFNDGGKTRTEALHAMPSGVVVSTCPLREEAQPEAIKKAKFTRTLRNTEGQALVQKLLGDSGTKKSEDGEALAWVNGQDNVWIAGAWCWDGMVLLEGCVVSAIRVAQDFGVAIPWEQS